MDARRPLRLPRLIGKRGQYRLLNLVALFAMVLFPLAGVGAAGTGPGATDPARAYAEWRDDEAFALVPSWTAGGQSTFSAFETNATLSHHWVLPVKPDAAAAGAGRILTSEHDSTVYAYRSGSSVALQVLNASYSSTAIATLPNLAARLSGSTDFLDVAVSDLDGNPTFRNGDYSDEVVVAYAQPGTGTALPVQVAVLAFGQALETSPTPTSITTATAVGTMDGAARTSGNFTPAGIWTSGDKSLAVTTGDFDMNGVDEIAVAYLSSPTTLSVEIFRYSVTLDPNASWMVINRSLSRVGGGSVTLAAGLYWNETLSLAAGDFDGDSRAELAVGTADHTYAVMGSATQTVHVRLFGFAAAANTACSAPPCLAATQVSDTSLHSGTFSGITGSYPWRAQVAAGLFKFAPNANTALNFGLNRRQLAVAAQHTDGLHLLTVEYASDRTATVGPYAVVPFAAPQFGFSLAAGGFKGNRTPTDPYSSLALATWAGQKHDFQMWDALAGSAPTNKRNLSTDTSGAYAQGARIPVIAADVDGDTMYLGAPVHITVSNVISADFLMQEPPKHTYWDPEAKAVVNVSRYDEFNIELSQLAKTEMSSSSTYTADTTMGGSLETSAATTAEGHADVGIAKVSEEVSLEATAKIGYEYEESEKQINTNYSERTVTMTGETTGDDMWLGRIAAFDIWRYRVYGLRATDAQGNSVNPFLDVVVPTVEYLDVGPEAVSTSDWYQPTHENGNVLSYPVFQVGDTFSPPDLGTYKIDCPAGDVTCVEGKKILSELLLQPREQQWDPTKTSLTLDFSQSSGGSSERSINHTLSENASIKAKTKTSVEVGGKVAGGSATVELSAQAEFSNKNSWGSVETTDNKTTTGTGIKLNKPAAPDTYHSYKFYPVIYTTTDGTVKATFAWSPVGNFWYDEYAHQPDLALNLPSRFWECDTCPTNISAPTYLPTLDSTRKQVRGFFLKSAELNPVTGEYDQLNAAPAAGDTVRVEVRVYNYSIAQPVPAGAKVRFVAVPYDSTTRSEDTDPANRKLIGETTLPALDPLATTTASVNWDTTDFGPATGQKASWRVYVQLDPPDSTHPNGFVANEKYETETPETAAEQYCDATTHVCVDPGQNNEGWGLADVAARVATGPRWDKPHAHVGMSKDGVAAINPQGEIVTGKVEAYPDQLVQIRVSVTSDQVGTDYSYVLVYDGDPDKGGKLIGSKQVFVGAAGGDAWLDWRPTEPGMHKLYAKVLQSIDDPAPGGNVGELKVQVIKAPPGQNK